MNNNWKKRTYHYIMYINDLLLISSSLIIVSWLKYKKSEDFLFWEG